jgi:rhamnulokinase
LTWTAAPGSIARVDRALSFLAIDLGAESGRGIVGRFDGERLRLEEVHRFPNQPVRLLDTLYWDFPRLFHEIKTAIARGAGAAGGRLAAVGVDGWGVDYGLLDERGRLLSNPVHYRDARTDGVMEEVFRRVPREEIFERTGIQFIQLNTLFQLYAQRRDQPGLLSQARRLLPIADLVNYFLTGRAVSEYTLATTTQLLDVRRRTWCRPLLDALDLPAEILPEVVPPGSILGPLREDIASECGLIAPPPVVAPACHDTAAAVAAVPAEGESGWAYLSSGTWSLLGIEIEAPRVTPEALRGNFTNEGGAGGKIRFLRNIMGLWLVQESRRQWAREGRDLDYQALARLAEDAPPLRSLVFPDDPSFFAPGDLPGRIRQYCERSSQPVPAGEGAVVRTALESLALAYRLTAERIEAVSGTRIERLHVVGGGSQNRLLNRFTAGAMQKPVVAGPAEATACGNILLSALALGHLPDLAALRRVVRASFETALYPPEDAGPWERAYQRFKKLETVNR